MVMLGYLVLTLIFGIYAEIKFRQNLSFVLSMLGKEYVHESGNKLEGEIKADANLHGNLVILNFLPPVGWIINSRVNHIENGVGYIGRNFTIPEPDRFKDTAECRSFGFDPKKKTDEELAEAMMSFVW